MPLSCETSSQFVFRTTGTFSVYNFRLKLFIFGKAYNCSSKSTTAQPVVLMLQVYVAQEEFPVFIRCFSHSNIYSLCLYMLIIIVIN